MAYNAFISYSHAVDGKLAPALQSALHHFAKPWYRMHALSVFRDQTSLAATPALWPSIEAALERSGYFLLMASPESARSHWVSREVEWWLTHRTIERLLIVLTGGELAWREAARDFDWEHTSALPALLRGRFADEPLYVDLRWARDENDLSLRHSRFRAVVLDIAAPLHGRPKDELDGEDVRQHRRTKRVAWAAASSLAALAVVASGAAWVAVRERRIAEDRRIRAEIGEKAARATNLLGSRPVDGLALAIAAASQNLDELPDEVLTPVRAVLLDAIQIARETNLFTGHPFTSNTVVPQSWIDSVAFSADGTQILSTGAERSVRIWGTTGPVGEPLVRALPTVRTAALSPDGRHIVTGGTDGYLRLWNRQGTEQSAHVVDPRAEVTSIAFNGQGSRMVISTSAGRVSIRDASGAAVRGSHSPFIIHATCAGFLTDGFVTGHADGVLRLWTLDGAALGDAIAAHSGSAVQSVIASDDGRYVLSVNTSGTARVHTRDGAPHGSPFRIEAEYPPVRFAFTPGARAIVAVWQHPGRGAQYTMLDVTGVPVTSPFGGYESQVRHLVFAPDTDHALTLGDDGAIRLWRNYPHQLRYDPSGRPFGNLPSRARIAAFSGDGSLIAVGGGDGTVQVYDTFGNQVAGPFRGHTDAVTAVAFDPGGRYVASGSRDSTVRRWEVDDGLLRRVGVMQQAIYGAAFRPDGTAIAAAGARVSQGIPGIQVWSLAGKQVAGVFHGSDEPQDVVFAQHPTRIVARSPRGISVWNDSDEQLASFQAPDAAVTAMVMLGPERLLTGDSRGRLQLWALGGEAEGRPEPLFDDGVTALAASDNGRLAAASARQIGLWERQAVGWVVRRRLDVPATALDLSRDGALIVAGTNDGLLRLWRWDDQPGPAQIQAHAGRVTTVKFSPGGDLVASASVDGTLRLWDRDGTPIGGPLRSPRGALTALAFSPDGALLATGDRSAVLSVWALSWQAWLRIACERLRHHPVLASAHAEAAARLCRAQAAPIG